ncbi:MAG: GGDEF domain-containing phosphodiesterase [Lachnospiraceae bacterium]|nr:GGDEF domain-containing phosphodiesterase [Lachnospiraceae bacterium]
MDNKKRTWLENMLGFYKDSKYVSDYKREANVRSSMYMSIVLIIIEVWMIIRYIVKYMIIMPDKYEITVSSFFQYTGSYWVLLIIGLIMFVYGLLFMKGRVNKNGVSSNIFITMFAGICLIFGVYVSYGDFARDKMIICFLTMVMYVAALLIWRPYISIILLTVISVGFLYLIQNYSISKETGEPIQMGSGDQINYITFFITLTMLAISIYQQRHREAIEAEKLYKASVTDDLTGIANMHRFDEETREYANQCAMEGEDIIFLFLDIENFKTYNDQLGYKMGDEFLKKIGHMIGEVFVGDPYARQSDDHFVVLTKVDGFMDRVSLMQAKIEESKDYEGYIALKVGGCRPEGNEMVDSRRCTDRARYAVSFIKNRSDEVFREYDEKMEEKFHQREYVLNNIDKAVKNGYIHVYYQPVMDSSNEKLCGCEALVRWIDPEMGFMSPGLFIPILEESRQIHKLDRCVYEIACRDMRNSYDNGLPVVPVSLNFSRLDFELMDAVDVLEELVTTYNIPRNKFHVEITESALTSDVEGLKKDMKRFHEKGYEIWLDDFGSGYSSLNVLKDFDFDLLKIDMVFLRGFENNQNSKVILKNIINLSNELGMKTLTEGVETREAVDFLEENGCGRLQGYFFGKPMPYEEIIGKIESGEFKVSENTNRL